MDGTVHSINLAENTNTWQIVDLLELLCRKADLSFLALNFISERVSEVAMGEHDKILFLRLKCFSGFMASILYCLTSHLEY